MKYIARVRSTFNHYTSLPMSHDELWAWLRELAGQSVVVTVSNDRDQLCMILNMDTFKPENPA